MTARLAYAAAALSVAALALGPPSRVEAAAGVGRCRTPGLVVWLDTQGGGAAGSVYYHLELTNLSGHRCTLLGYPGVSAVDLAGRQVGRAAERDRSTKTLRVVLASHSTAAAVLQIADVADYPASVCRRTTAAGLRVYPPGATVSKIVPFPFRACSRPGPEYLHVRAVRKA